MLFTIAYQQNISNECGCDCVRMWIVNTHVTSNYMVGICMSFAKICFWHVRVYLHSVVNCSCGCWFDIQFDVVVATAAAARSTPRHAIERKTKLQTSTTHYVNNANEKKRKKNEATAFTIWYYLLKWISVIVLFTVSI